MSPFPESAVERAVIGHHVDELAQDLGSFAGDGVTEHPLMSVTARAPSHAYDDVTAAGVAPRSRDTLTVLIPVTVIYLMILITGILGNVTTCLVIRRNKSMHTATNFYLFSLSISDLLLLITGLPQEMYCIWARYRYIFGEAVCIIRGLAAETSANATVLTITAFTVERYMAICHPFYSHTLSKLSRATRLIVVIWIVALAFAIPTAAQVGVVVKENSDYANCTIKDFSYAHYFCFLTVIFFLIPMNVIIVLYALIGLRLRRSNRMELMATLSEPAAPTEAADGHHPTLSRRRGTRSSSHKSSRRVLKMLVAVVIAFFLCWAPFHTQRLVAIYGTNSDNTPKSPHMPVLYGIITYISGILYYLSTTINPILYSIMSHRFREAFKETVWVCCGRCREDNHRQQYNNLPQRIQRPYKIGETDFASRCPPGVADSKSGSSTRRTGSKSLARRVETQEVIVRDIESPTEAPYPQPWKAPEKPEAVVPPDVKSPAVDRLFTVHRALTDAGTSEQTAGKVREGEEGVVAASATPGDRPGAGEERDEKAVRVDERAPQDSGQPVAKIPG